VEVALVTGRELSLHRRGWSIACPIPLTLIVNNGAGGEAQRPARPSCGTCCRATRRRARPRRDAATWEDSVAVVFDRPRRGGRSCSSTWTGRTRNRRGYYDKNKDFITRAAAPLSEMLTEDPIQVMFQRRRSSRCAPLVATLRAMPIADRFFRRGHRVRGPRLLAGRHQRRRPARKARPWRPGSPRPRLDRGRPSPAIGRQPERRRDARPSPATAFVMGNATDALKSRGLSPRPRATTKTGSRRAVS